MELLSIVDFDSGGLAIDAVTFPNTPWWDSFWTSTPYAESHGAEWWAISFNQGLPAHMGGGMTNEVRCVQ
jgi:hypothetical protein